jgi:diguanylate cyclase (GGDEF)-like protein
MALWKSKSKAMSVGSQGTSKTRFNKLMVFGLCLLISVTLYMAAQAFNLGGLLEDFELKSYDLRILMNSGVNSPKQPSNNIMIVTFDDPTLYHFEDTYGTWPWPRSLHADMIAFLNRAKAKRIVYDIMFIANKKGSEADDQKLVQTFLKYPNVYLSMNFDNFKLENQALGKGISERDINNLKPLRFNLSPQMKERKSNLHLGPDGFFQNDTMSFNNFRPILSGFYGAKERIGFINHGRDSDGVSRGNPLFFRFQYQEPVKSTATPYQYDAKTKQWRDQKNKLIDEQGYLLTAKKQRLLKEEAMFFPHLSLLMILDEKFPHTGKARTQQHYKVGADGHFRFGNYDIPLNRDGNLLVSWYNVNSEQMQAAEALNTVIMPERVKLLQNSQLSETVKLQQLQKIDQAAQYFNNLINQSLPPNPYPMVPAWKILNLIEKEKTGTFTQSDRQQLEQFKNKTIFVGMTSVAGFDIKTTPISRLLPGVILQANLFDNLQQNNGYVQRVSPTFNLIITISLCALSAYWLISMRNAFMGVFTALIITAFYISISFLLFKTHLLWVDLAVPVVSLILTITSTFAIKYFNKDEDFEKTYKLATTDGLTGLYNHRYFQEYVAHQLEKCGRNSRHFSIILVDIDFFKKFNDTYGHQAGDTVLKQVAIKLSQSVRKGDLVARYGGEEMAVVLDEADEEIAYEIAEKLVKAIAQDEFKLSEGLWKHVTISAGVSVFPQNGKSAKDLIEHSDQGLYAAKKSGRNQVGRQSAETDALELQH